MAFENLGEFAENRLQTGILVAAVKPAFIKPGLFLFEPV